MLTFRSRKFTSLIPTGPLQDLHTGLIASSASSTDAWIRDNVYCISAVWALASAYKAASDQSEDMIKVRWLQSLFVPVVSKCAFMLMAGICS